MTSVARIMALSVLVVVGGANWAHAASFRIDPARSSLVLQVFRDGVAARLGHDHVVEARQFSGTITHDPATPAASSIDVAVEVGSLVADDPATRRQHGLAGELSARDVADIDKAMKSEEQLDAARFPAITFRSSAITPQADGQYLVTGTLTIRGVANQYTFPAQVGRIGEDLRGRARLAFKQSSFGYRPYRAALGAIRNKDEVILHIDLVAR
jgi:polyisoprenoid-binding protein YceI